ncbi:uncharacterized protein LOC129602400 [Paramacrobiotus metropolitanus]|uniref:uncharacterized protein LOC129602400 n=1 Tax=Paramacrobiotus metropolitanus TaxID=2943436 RepID=UPI0024461828|nr:uncharacterized protein LOC129602400 [Paramacrobiotus metropolitanus]
MTVYRYSAIHQTSCCRGATGHARNRPIQLTSASQSNLVSFRRPYTFHRGRRAEIVSDLRVAKGQLQLNGFDNAGGAQAIARELITKITEQGIKGFFGRIWRWFKRAVRIAHRVIAFIDGFVNGSGKANDATADDSALIKSVSEVVDYFKPHAAKEIGAAYQFAADSVLITSTQHHTEVVRAAQDFLGFLVKYEGTLGKVYAETVQAVESLIKE